MQYMTSIVVRSVLTQDSFNAIYKTLIVFRSVLTQDSFNAIYDINST